MFGSMSGDARDFNNIETRPVIKLSPLQGMVQKEIHAILTETLACFLLFFLVGIGTYQHPCNLTLASMY